MRKIIMSLAVVALIVSALPIMIGQSKTATYYSGDAINYQGKLIIASVDSGALELFRLDGNVLVRTVRFNPSAGRFGTDAAFFTVLLHQEIGKLFAYTSTGEELYKYDVSNPNNIVLVNKIKDNSDDWFGALEISNGQLITKGSKGVKIWNRDLQVIDSFNIYNNTNPYSITLGDGYDYIFNVVGSQVELFNRQTRQVTGRVTLYNENKGNVKIYNDNVSGMFYVADGHQLKKFNYQGELHKSMSHDSSFGYDVEPSVDGINIYFTNGNSIKKLDKLDLSLQDEYQNRTDLNYWAMGLRVVADQTGEKVVVFNNATITVFDSNLDIVAFIKAATESSRKVELPTSKLSLQTNVKSAHALQEIIVVGQGYAAYEPVNISLGSQKVIAYADQAGGFAKHFTIAPQEVGRKDIKATGEKSNQTYSISFEIIEL